MTHRARTGAKTRKKPCGFYIISLPLSKNDEFSPGTNLEAGTCSIPNLLALAVLLVGLSSFLTPLKAFSLAD